MVRTSTRTATIVETEVVPWYWEATEIPTHPVARVYSPILKRVVQFFIITMVSGNLTELLCMHECYTDTRIVDTRVGYADGDKKFGWNVLNWSGGWPSV